MTYKEALRENLDKANKVMAILEEGGDIPVDVAQTYVMAGQAFINAALVSAVQDLTGEVHELVKKAGKK